MLKHNITLLSGIAIAISMVIGSGIFGLPGLVIEATSPVNAFLGWIVIIAIMPAMIHVFSRLGMRWPDSGGVTTYAAHGFGEWSTGGVFLLTCATMMIGMPAFFFVGGSYICKLLAISDPHYVFIASILLAGFTTIINVAGIQWLSFVNKLSVLMVIIIVIIILYENAGSLSQLKISQIHDDWKHASLYKVWLASSIIFWAFQGWENMTFGLEEVTDPQKNIPKIFWFSFLLVSCIYLFFAAMISASSLLGRNVNEIAGLSALLPVGILGRALLLLMVVVLIANASAWVFGASRAYLSAANHKLLPVIFYETNDRGIPTKGLWLLFGLYSVVIGLIGYFGWNIRILFMITTQDCIILYGGSILAFLRNFSSLHDRLISVLAIISWFYLMSGFGYIMIFSIFFFGLGVLITYWQRRLTIDTRN